LTILYDDQNFRSQETRAGSSMSGFHGTMQELRNEYLKQRQINEDLLHYLQKCLE